MMNEEIKGKRKARKLALQALYQWHMSHAVLTDIQAQYASFNDMSKVDATYFAGLLQGVAEQVGKLDETLIPYLDRPIEQLNPIELTVLRIGCFELIHRLEIPYRVVLDEAVSLTKLFGAKEGYRFVNGVLNKVAKAIRVHEEL